ncbi:hypothetical protein VB776_19840 [Arcicella sp. DC2W]|uniref:Uncharacterized protein n=1 Tax=Arcicella gelida TaxID=2984195 RepID=A0ABU5SAG7_9BACT|nr:hypothetical protein [Arcicella sp. DC2W]MEA5405198.1 hypothetical protein [Arcicella sp. DC2W]
MKIFNRRLNIELLVGTVAIFTSVISIFIYLEQLKMSREQQKASVYPYLWFEGGVYDNNVFHYEVDNKGVGPAFIKNVEVYYQQKKYESFSKLFTSEWVRINGSDFNKFPYYFNDIENGSVMKIGEEKELYVLKNNQTLALHLGYKVMNDSSFHFKILYEDVYGGGFLNHDNKITAIEKQ